MIVIQVENYFLFSNYYTVIKIYFFSGQVIVNAHESQHNNIKLNTTRMLRWLDHLWSCPISATSNHRFLYTPVYNNSRSICVILIVPVHIGESNKVLVPLRKSHLWNCFSTVPSHLQVSSTFAHLNHNITPNVSLDSIHSLESF